MGHEVIFGGRTDAEGIFRFNLTWKRSTIVFEAYSCSDEAFQPRQLTNEQRQRIIPRIVAYLQRDGTRVTVLSEAPHQPLRPVDDILQERLRRRSGQQNEFQ